MTLHEVTPEVFGVMAKNGLLKKLRYSEWAALAIVAHVGTDDPLTIATRAGMPESTAANAVRRLRELFRSRVVVRKSGAS